MGQVDVDGMLASISSRLLSEWMVYAQLEPWGEERADLRAGIVASTVANVNRAKGAKALTAQDFMPQFDAEAEASAPDPERLLAKVAALNAKLGGRDLRQ